VVAAVLLARGAGSLDPARIGRRQNLLAGSGFSWSYNTMRAPAQHHNASPATHQLRAQAAQPPTDHDNDLLTAGEVALLLRVTPDWVYAQTRSRRIPHLRLGRYVRYRRRALIEWMEAVESSSSTQPWPRR
jgi:excisionase family DNA binding protein